MVEITNATVASNFFLARLLQKLVSFLPVPVTYLTFNNIWKDASLEMVILDKSEAG